MKRIANSATRRLRLKTHPAPPHVQTGLASVLLHPSLMVQRKLEILNIVAGFEQANMYSIKSPKNSADFGSIAEDNAGIMGMFKRQALHTRRPMNANVLDQHGSVVLRIERPFKWLLNSKIIAKRPDGSVIGGVRQEWHLWRRRYVLFLGKNETEFGTIDGELLAWNFDVLNLSNRIIANITKNFQGIAKEIFADAGQYLVNLEPDLTIKMRAVVLACAMNADIDYFSRHSSHMGGGGIFPMPMFFGGFGGGAEPEQPVVSDQGNNLPPSSTGAEPIYSSDSNARTNQGTPLSPLNENTLGHPNQQINNWGESPFLPDEDKDVNKEDSASGWLDQNEDSGYGGGSGDSGWFDD